MAVKDAKDGARRRLGEFFVSEGGTVERMDFTTVWVVIT